MTQSWRKGVCSLCSHSHSCNQGAKAAFRLVSKTLAWGCKGWYLPLSVSLVPPRRAHTQPRVHLHTQANLLVHMAAWTGRFPKSAAQVNFKDCTSFSLHTLKTAPRTGLCTQYRLLRGVGCWEPSAPHLLLPPSQVERGLILVQNRNSRRGPEYLTPV